MYTRAGHLVWTQKRKQS